MSWMQYMLQQQSHNFATTYLSQKNQEISIGW